MTEKLIGLSPRSGNPSSFSYLHQEHIRCYQIAGLTIKVQADLPIQDQTFHSKFNNFLTSSAEKPTLNLFLHFHRPELEPTDLGQIVFQTPPWVIYRRKNSWLYLGFPGDGTRPYFQKIGLFSLDHLRGDIYCPGKEVFQQGHLTSLSLLPTDQIFLARVMADYQGCYLHSAGMIIKGQGLLFAGHSDAGKSTVATLLQDEGELLCDDRMIIRRWPEGLKIHGTWSHGDISKVSSASAPLKAIFFLEKAPTNQLVPLDDRREVVRRLLFLVIKPLVTADWWEKTLNIIEKIAQGVPCYILKFDRSGKVGYVIKEAGL